MVKTRTAIRVVVRQLLRDEFVVDTDAAFEDDELDVHIDEALIEVSQKRPHEVKETLKTSNRTGTATATTASHLIDTTNNQFVAGDVGKTVYNSTDGTTAKVTAYVSTSNLTLDTDIMASGETYYIYHYQGTSGKDLNLSSIEDLLEVEKAEYQTRQDPPEFRNVKVFGDVCTLDVESEPEDDEEVFLYCHKVHSLTKTTSSLKPDLERVLVEGVVAKAALAWLNEMRTQIVATIATVASFDTTLTDMAARITQAITDLSTGRALIGAKETAATTAISNMSGRMSKAIADLTSGRDVVGANVTYALAAIDDMTALLTQAVTDLGTGRATIGAEQADMEGAIDNMTGRIGQAIDDLTTGRALINKVNIGGAPESDYAHYAVTELGNAARYLDQGKGYLAKATMSDRYAQYAARDIQTALGYLSQARGYLATNDLTGQYAGLAARELQTANTYLNQAQGYLATGGSVTQYGVYAARELSAAGAYLNKSGVYLRKITAQLNAVASMPRYQAWAQNQLVLYQRDLQGLSKSKAWEFYPRG